LGSLALLATGCDDTADVQPDAGFVAPTVPAEQLAHARALYDLHCGFCHGEHGEGYVSDNANALNRAEFLSVATDAFLTAAIVHGRPGTAMPTLGAEPYGGPLDADDVAALVALIRSWQTVASVDVHDEVHAGEPLRGVPLFAAACAECHGADGQGGLYQSVANPWLLETASDGLIAHAIRHGRPGPVDTDMPAFGDRLNDQQISDLVALIRSWQVPVEGPPPAQYEPDPANAVINPDGEAPTFALREDKFVAAADVWAAYDGGQRMIFLDARGRTEFLREHITGAVNVPHFELEQYLDQFPRDTWIIPYCGCPHAISGRAWDILAGAGFTQIAVLDEGYYFWKAQGWPVQPWSPPEK
jgi:cytochrome c oxidase cbb3-type subunit 3/ubiquinol-cytochrome c reductase cytochrome c subunit